MPNQDRLRELLHGRIRKQRGNGFQALCPTHDDKEASLSVTFKPNGRTLMKCHAGCESSAILEAIGADWSILFPPSENGKKPKAEIVETYDYRNAAGELLSQAVRKYPKGFFQRRPGDNGEWIPNLDGVPKVPYCLPELLHGIREGKTVFIAEGEKDVHRLQREGLIATCNASGAGNWLIEHSEYLRNALAVVILPDNDQSGRDHAESVAASIRKTVNPSHLRVVHLPGLPEKGDVTDWFRAGGTKEELLRLVKEAPEWEPGQPTAAHQANGKHSQDCRGAATNTAPANNRHASVTTESTPTIPTPVLPAVTLADVEATFRQWLHLPDTGVVRLVLATVAANRVKGDPVWLMIVGASGGGKTEQMMAASHLPDVLVAASLSEAALLSGTARRDKAADASGGLLRRIGDRGLLLLKDFTSILAQHRDSQGPLLAALREIYDGEWTRHIGTDGGRTLTWSGKLGVIAGCTPAIDEQHSVMAAMGERFVFYRMPPIAEDLLAGQSISLSDTSDEMRAAISEAVQAFAASWEPERDLPAITDEERDRLIALSCLSARCRSAVPRDPRTKEILSIPTAEAPGRLARILARLFRGLLLIGVDREEAWELTARVALDSMPQLRRRCLQVLEGAGEPIKTRTVADALDCPTETVRRSLQDLTAHGATKRHSDGQGTPDEWELSDWCREYTVRAGVGFTPKYALHILESTPKATGIGGERVVISNPLPIEEELRGEVTGQPNNSVHETEGGLTELQQLGLSLAEMGEPPPDTGDTFDFGDFSSSAQAGGY